MEYVIELLKRNLDYTQTERWIVEELEFKGKIGDIIIKEKELSAAISILEKAESKNEYKI